MSELYLTSSNMNVEEKLFLKKSYNINWRYTYKNFYFNICSVKYRHSEIMVHISCDISFKALFLKVSFRGYWAQMMFRD